MPAGCYFRAEPLCYSLNNNEVPLLTISAEDTPAHPIAVGLYFLLAINDREIISVCLIIYLKL